MKSAKKKKKRRKVYVRLMDCKIVRAMLALLFHDRQETTSLLFKEEKQKEGENGFLELLCNRPRAT